MNFMKFRQTWANTVGQKNAFQVTTLALTATVVMLSILLFTKDKTIVLVPPVINESVELSQKTAASGFKKTWGLYLAGLIGNVKPGNADLIVTELQSLMRPDVLQAFKSALAQQLEQIRRDQLSVEFEATQIYYEKESDRVFVLGKSNITGPLGKSGKFQRVFEFGIEVKSFAPVVTFLDTYEGDPHTTAWRDREEKRAQREAEKGVKPDESATQKQAN